MAKQTSLKSLTLALALVFASFATMAQTFVKGTVYEADGQTPAIGATVLQKGTNNGVSSGVDGTYSIQLKGKNPVLIFRMIGCEEQEVKVGSQKEINVTMKNQGVALDDVVVTALGIS
ncbi:MAG: carboxypeptidase-like regulatory domain-containing protein, partial [Muribaculaceae bacterium]